MPRCFFILISLLIAGCGHPKRQLNVFIWSEYIDRNTVAEFERRFDCKVALDFYDSSDALVAKLAAGGDSIYDIVVPSNRTLPILAGRGLLAPLRHENLPLLTNIAPQFVNPFFDPGNRHGVPYHWDTTGLYLRKPTNGPVDETWGLIFDAKKQSGPFLLMDDLRACIGAALRYRGFSLNTTNRDELIQARDLLIEARKRSLGFEGSTGAKNRVLSRGAAVAMTFREVLGVKEDPDTYYCVPREGSAISVDLLCIPARAPHRDLAEQFINYILEPRVAARLADAIGSATANQAALEFIHPADRTNPAIYVTPTVMARLEFARDLGENNRLYDELWTQIKSK